MRKKLTLWLLAAALFAGDESGLIRPDEPVTRAQLAAILRRFPER